MNKSFGQTIKELREEKGWSQTDLAKKTGLAQGSISRIEQGRQTNLTEETKNKLLHIFGKEKFSNVEFSNIPLRHSTPIPIISWVHAGEFEYSADNFQPGVSEGEPVYSKKQTSPNSFGLKIIGDSMETRYQPGDIIIVDPVVHCDNGSPCVVKLNNEVTFKLFYETEKEIRLVALNDKYPDIIIRKDSKADFKIIGKVVDMIPKL